MCDDDRRMFEPVEVPSMNPFLNVGLAMCGVPALWGLFERFHLY